ncbi:MAG: M15 family metallopeptidase [Pseudooceanicola sp.]|nr:M15 family metallopeptidase [Pseudooceanicola sp.]
MRYVPAIIVAIALLLVPVIWVLLSYLLQNQESFEGSAVDSGARIEIEVLRQQVEDLQERLAQVQTEVAQIPRGISGGGPFEPNQDEEDAILRGNGPNAILDSYAQVVLIANRTDVNNGLEVAGPDYLEAKLGRPREVLTDTCEAMTNEALKAKLVLEEVGPIRVRMLQPAVDSLRRVFANVERADPDLYARINTSGSLCVRRIRGTVDRLSTHSYGLAVDLNIDGQLDMFTDGKTQLGLTILAGFFNQEGWVWGAGFNREDSMHFEISRKQLDEWLANGEL